PPVSMERGIIPPGPYPSLREGMDLMPCRRGATLALAHAAQRQDQFLFPVEQFHQQHHAFLAIHAQENGFQLGEAALDNAHAIAGLQQGLRLGLSALLKGIDERLRNFQRIAAEADQAIHAAGGTQGGPVAVRVQLHEEVAGEQGLDHSLSSATYKALTAQQWPIAVISLPNEVLLGTLVLTRFAVYEVPGGGGRRTDSFAQRVHVKTPSVPIQETLPDCRIASNERQIVSKKPFTPSR